MFNILLFLKYFSKAQYQIYSYFSGCNTTLLVLLFIFIFIFSHFIEKKTFSSLFRGETWVDWEKRRILYWDIKTCVSIIFLLFFTDCCEETIFFFSSFSILCVSAKKKSVLNQISKLDHLLMTRPFLYQAKLSKLTANSLFCFCVKSFVVKFTSDEVSYQDAKRH
jgi:hypothetical protein